jgi:hypothetical protein
MKSPTEMRETATKKMGDLADTGKKAAMAAVGAPVVAGKAIADWSGKFGKNAQKQFEAWVVEGEKLTKQLRDGNVVDEIKDRVDFEQIQGRVEKLRDQLEDVLSNWKDNFKPQAAEKAAATPKPKKATTKKATPKAKAEKVDA